jgi:hypothetical protein
LKQYIVPSTSCPLIPHVVEYDGVRFYCTCRGYEYRNECRHITTIKDELGISTSDSSFHRGWCIDCTQFKSCENLEVGLGWCSGDKFEPRM